MKSFSYFLYPLGIIYGLVAEVRNLLYDLRVLPSISFHVPVICVGNLSMGGTGKTPFTEYLVRLFKDRIPTAVLSRGYKRKSRGFLIVSKRSNVQYTGDEPLQYVRKFDNITVALDEKRDRGIRLLLEKHPELGVILLDDAMQHRRVKPGLTILLTDYYNPYPEDHIFPVGTLREFRSGSDRADIIIVTKTPKIFSPISRRRILEDLRVKAHQRVYFSFLHHGDPLPLSDSQYITEYPERVNIILLVTGIGNDGPLCEHLKRKCNELVRIGFRDHHSYTVKNLEMITRRFHDLPTRKKVIITTEKDVMRLRTPQLSGLCKVLPIFYIPISMEFHGNEMESFDKQILEYVSENQRDH